MLGRVKAAARELLRKREDRIRFERVVNAHHNVSVIDPSRVYDARKQGFTLSESALFGLNEKNIGEYITTWEGYQPRLAEKPHFVVSDDKMLFSFAMEGIVEVPRIYAVITAGRVESVSDEELTNSNLYDFFLKNQGGVLKARSGYNGYGIHVYTTDGAALFERGEAVSREAFDKVVAGSKSCLVQNRMEQGAYARGLFEDSVNTLRIISMKTKDSNAHEVVAAVQRIGTRRSAPVDNFSQGGASALIDLETGTLSAMTCIDSYDASGNRVFFDRHPDTGAQIRGITVPDWAGIKRAIADITRKRPFFDLVAWDIVLKDDGIAVIETNMKSTLGVFQVHGGMRSSLLGQKYKEFGYIKD